MPAHDPAEGYRSIRDGLPEHVSLAVAAKERTVEEVAAVIEAGATVIAENYVQEAEAARAGLGEAAGRVEWHMIGHLQRNKVNKALPLFDVIQSLDSGRLARALDARAEAPVRCLVEVNVAGEGSKTGVAFDQARALVEEIAALPNLRLEGLMTMEPYCEDPEDARPFFRRMKALFDEVAALELPGTAMRTLSMGMTHSYRIAVEEGATMVRVGTAIFGAR